MIIKTQALFTTVDNSTDVEELINKEVGDVVEQIVDGEKTVLVPGTFVFDFKDVAAFNRSCTDGYTQLCFCNGQKMSVKMQFERVERLYKLCKG